MALAGKGIDVRVSGSTLVIRVSLKDSTGARLTAANTIRLRLFAVQLDGTYGSLRSYDFNNNTFVTNESDIPTTAYAAMGLRTVSGRATGIWTCVIPTLTAFTVGGVYIAQVSDETGTPTASPIDQEREFQYGGDQGDQIVAPTASANATAAAAAILVTPANKIATDSSNRVTATVPVGQCADAMLNIPVLRAVATSGTVAAAITNEDYLYRGLLYGYPSWEQATNANQIIYDGTKFMLVATDIYYVAQTAGLTAAALLYSDWNSSPAGSILTVYPVMGPLAALTAYGAANQSTINGMYSSLLPPVIFATGSFGGNKPYVLAGLRNGYPYYQNTDAPERFIYFDTTVSTNWYIGPDFVIANATDHLTNTSQTTPIGTWANATVVSAVTLTGLATEANATANTASIKANPVTLADTQGGVWATAVSTFMTVWNSLLQFVSGSSGPKQFTAQALANASAGAGTGPIAYPFQVKDCSGNPLYNCAVSVFLDQAMTMQVPATGTLQTNQSGEVVFYLTAGTYWFFCVMSGVTFSPNPVEVTVS